MTTDERLLLAAVTDHVTAPPDNANRIDVTVEIKLIGTSHISLVEFLTAD